MTKPSLAFSEVNAEQEGPEFSDRECTLAWVKLLLLKNTAQVEAKPYVDHGEKLARDYSQDFWFPLYLCTCGSCSRTKAWSRTTSSRTTTRWSRPWRRHKLHRQLLYALFSYPNEWDSQKSMKDSLWMVEKGISLR
jgi:hypothetical protein